MLYFFTFLSTVLDVMLGLAGVICIACIISHIVRRHVLGDRQQDLVCKINLAILQGSDDKQIEAMKYEEQCVFATMQSHKRMIILNVVNILIVAALLAIIAVIISAIGNTI
ncbi:hypothetical protein SAMN06296952_2174 [Oscillospiraceae bacterium]|nr:hypothetical protein SAMN06296952_2174 [Oscillospiraceae bacterium]